MQTAIRMTVTELHMHMHRCPTLKFNHTMQAVDQTNNTKLDPSLSSPLRAKSNRLDEIGRGNHHHSTLPSSTSSSPATSSVVCLDPTFSLWTPIICTEVELSMNT